MYKRAYRRFWTLSDFTTSLRYEVAQGVPSKLAMLRDQDVNHIGNIVCEVAAHGEIIPSVYQWEKDCWVEFARSSGGRAVRA